MLQLFEGDGGAIDVARAPQLSFLATPGHTPGHIVVCVTPAGEAAPRAVYVGDALHVRCMCAAHTLHALRAACVRCMRCMRCMRCTRCTLCTLCTRCTQHIAHRTRRI